MESSRAKGPPPPQWNSPEEEINLYVKVNKTISMKVKKSETIKNLKVMLREKEGILEDRQVLSFDGRRLEHDHRIMDNDIPNKSIIQLSEKSQRLKLYFRMPSNENNFELEADNNEEFCGIKSIMQSKLGIPKDKYTIYYAGKVVENHQTVASLNIQGAEAILQMVCNPKDLLLFSVETPTKGKKEIKVKCTFTILDVKKLVESMTNYPSEDWDLFSGGTRLQNSKTLAYYEIKEHDILKMLPAMYQISVRTRTGKILTLEVRQSDTIRAVKENIFQQTDVPVNHQGLMFGGQKLEDDKDLAHYSIEEGFTLHELTR